jgi:ankyrin repeat protein
VANRSHPFWLAEKLRRHCRKSLPTYREGLEFMFAKLGEHLPSFDWGHWERKDWECELDSWVAWVNRLCDRFPPPNVEVAWFEKPSSDTDIACTIVTNGWSRSGYFDDGYGTDAEPVWPVDASGKLAPDCKSNMRLLAALIDRLEACESNAEFDGSWAVKAAVLALESTVSLLCILNGFGKTRLWTDRQSTRPIGVVTGWKAGEVEVVGGFSSRGWGPMPRPALVRDFPQAPSEHDRCDPRRYLKRGGDPNWRDPADGKTLLHKSWYERTIVRALVEAGADVNARDQEGRSVIYARCTNDLQTLKFLLSAGADPTVRATDGSSVMDRLVRSGACTPERIELFRASGLAVPTNIIERKIILSACADTEMTSRVRTLLRYALKHGESVNRTCEDGLTPLWAALSNHARYKGQVSGSAEARSGRYDKLAMILLEHSADPNTRWPLDATHWIPKMATPLMVRSYWNPELTQSLLKHGADPFALCANGRMAIDYARESLSADCLPDQREAAHVVRLLEKAMSRRLNGHDE